MKLISHPDVQITLDSYPPAAQRAIWKLRTLILDVAGRTDGVKKLEETLKWGEPSYLTKTGSTIRIAWKEKTSEHFSIFFKCTSKLVPTFRFLYPETFHFEGNREIRFRLGQELPEKELAHCIKLALVYHHVKQLPLLGA